MNSDPILHYIENHFKIDQRLSWTPLSSKLFKQDIYIYKCFSAKASDNSGKKIQRLSIGTAWNT